MKTTARETRIVRSVWNPFRLLLTMVLGMIGLLSFPLPGSGQYFGRNKVQYDDFDFRVLHTPEFDIYFYEREGDRIVEDFGRMAERWYERFARTFQYSFEKKKPVLVYANKADFQQTNAIPGFLSQGTGGVTESVKNRVVMPMAGTYAETDHVLGHELIHAFQYDIASTTRGGGATGFEQSPPWLIEGMPEYLSRGRRDPQTAMWMRDAVLHDRVPTIRQLNEGTEFFPYRFGHALWAFIAGTYGDDAVPALFRAVASTGYESAFRQVLGVHPDTLSRAWVDGVKSYYRPMLEGRTPPEDAGRRILAPDLGAGEMNLSPSLSPDGELVAFYSEKDLFSVDLYLADARTGEVLGRLASADRNPHFDNLFFISSSGAWSPDGARFAFVTFAEGDNGIAIAGIEDREVRRTLRLDGIGAIFSLDWSPDGSSIAFSGSARGQTDLYVLDLESGSLRQLTDDRFAELHPAWSPDGRTLAFATDRGEDADLERLSLPPLGLGIMNVESGEITVARPLGHAKHIDPKWSPDGQSVFFVSDRDGFTDVYRLELESGALFQVTHLATGISGVSPDAPALSVARGSGDMAFTVFEDGKYVGYGLEAAETKGRSVTPGEGGDDRPAMLPPFPTTSNQEEFVAEYLDDPTLGLPVQETFRVTDYDPGLQLDYLAQPSFGVAVDRFGTGLGGSVAAFFSDMMGDHQLGVSLQAQGSFQDIGGQVAYMNRKKRVNWGGRGGRIPFRTGFTRSGTTTVAGEELRYLDFVLARSALYRVSAAMEYPLSRTNRIEVDGGVSHFTYDREVTRSYFTPEGGFVGRDNVSPGSVGLEAPDGLTLYHGMVAYVGDFSYFGLTSPVDGGRYRVEAEGNFGDLNFVNVLGDFRRYVFFKPLTLAFRAMHYGRYGTDSENRRLTPLFLGNGTLVRGYSVNSFGSRQCGSDQGSGCAQFDRLVGSKVAVGNLELRVPLLGTERFGLVDADFLPTELAIFLDGGVAWTRDESPDLTIAMDDPGRIPVFSAGGSLRFNVLGRLVAEVYWARAFQRDRSSQFGFQVSPGW